MGKHWGRQTDIHTKHVYLCKCYDPDIPTSLDDYYGPTNVMHPPRYPAPAR